MPVEPDERISVMLAPGERVVAVRRDVSVERRKESLDPDQALHGDLYVTTTRLLCLGHVQVDVPLAEIREAIVASGAVRLVVGDGRGLEIRTTDPFLLRVEIAAVRQADRQRPMQESLEAAKDPEGASRGSAPPRGTRIQDSSL